LESDTSPGSHEKAAPARFSVAWLIEELMVPGTCRGPSERHAAAGRGADLNTVLRLNWRARGVREA